MTKAQKPAPVPDAEGTDVLATSTDPSVEYNWYYQRESALRIALDFHKNNGGMLTPQQLVDHARIFSTFLQGESK